MTSAGTLPSVSSGPLAAAAPPPPAAAPASAPKLASTRTAAVAEGEHLVAGRPATRSVPRPSRVLAAQPQRRPVHLVRRAGHAALPVERVLGPDRRLRQPGRVGRPEAVRRGVGLPRQRHPAAVAAALGVAGAQPGRVLAGVVGQRRCARAGRAPRPGRGRPSRAAPASAGSPRGPGAGRARRPAAGRRRRCRCGAGCRPAGRAGRRAGPRRGWTAPRSSARRPASAAASERRSTARWSAAVQAAMQVVEVERLVHLVGADVAGQPLGRLHPRLGDQDPVAGVAVEERAPAPVDLVHAVLVPHRRRGRWSAPPGAVSCGSSQSGRPACLDQAVGDVDPEAVDAAVQPEPQDVDRTRRGPPGWSQFRSGWLTSNRCRYHWPGPSAR